MNIFSILSESRNPSTNKGKLYSKPSFHSSMRIVVEAEEDNKKEDNKPEVNDTQTDNKPEPNKPNEEKNDEKEDNKPDNNELDENNPDDAGGDIPGLDGDDTSADNMGSNNMGGTSSYSDVEIPKDEIDPDKTKSQALLDDATTLYYSIKRIIEKLDNVSGDDIEIIQSFIQAKDNFINLSDLLFDFITQRFTTNSYVKNLYIFNYFIQTYKLNVDILEKTLKSKSE